MGELYLTNGDPNGVQMAMRPAMAYSPNGSLWIKTNDGVNTTGWELVFGDGT